MVAADHPPQNMAIRAGVADERRGVGRGPTPPCYRTGPWGAMTQWKKRIRVLFSLAAVLSLSGPQRASACACCACELGTGAILCATKDPEFQICAAFSGVPASDCWSFS